MQAYTTSGKQTTGTTQVEEREKQPYSLRKSIEAIKDGVPIADYAAELTELRQNGQALRGRCPLHKGDNPQSFAVYATEGRFYCYRCNAGGDVIDLAQAAEGGEVWEAVVSLSMRFGVELPKRPASWHRHLRHKHEARKRAINALTNSYQRRLYRIYASALEDIADPQAHRQEAEALFRDLRPMAYYCAKARAER
jgi:DNA primase